MLLLLGKLLLRILHVVASRGDLGRLDVAPENIAVSKVEELPDAVGHEAAQGHVEDGVELLERLLLGLGHEQQHQDEPDQVPGGVPREGARVRPRRDERRPREREQRVEEPRRRRREGHAYRADVERVGLGRVREGHGLFVLELADGSKQRNPPFFRIGER